MNISNLLRRKTAIKSFFSDSGKQDGGVIFVIIAGHSIRTERITVSSSFIMSFFLRVIQHPKKTTEKPGSFQQIDDYLFLFVLFSEICHFCVKAFEQSCASWYNENNNYQASTKVLKMR